MKIIFRNFLLSFCALLLVAGCGAAPAAAPVEEPPPEEPRFVRTPVAGAISLEDGRKSQGFAKGGIGDEMTNVFFSFCVNQAELTEEFEGEKTERGYVYLVAEVTVKNAFDGPIPMWADDFIAQWGEAGDENCYPVAKSADTQMEEEFTLGEGRSVTKNLVYEVPRPEGMNEYGISYLEYYEDQAEGNRFMISFKLSMPPKPAPEEETE